MTRARPAFVAAIVGAVTLTTAISSLSAAPGDLPPFEFCGQLVQPPFCGISLATPDGSVFLLDDTGPFTVGDMVTVSGPITLACPTLPRCSTGVCLEVHAIAAADCPPNADLDGDGHVNAADLAQLLALWGLCPPLTIGCSGDLTYDGVVDSADLSVLLGSWTG